ncbi:MAG: cytochrome P450 [Gelidibacter sp.]|nr:cytochrome P450 [Gelidibacter sp.]
MSRYNYPYRISFFQFLLHSSEITKNPIRFHHKYFSQSKDDSFSIKPFFSKPIILTRDAVLARHILQKHHKVYEKSKLQTKFLSRYLGYGLLTSVGDYWLQQRRLIQPGFHKEKINNLVAIINSTVNEQVNTIKTGSFVALYPIMNELAFEVVAKSLFNYSAEKQTLKRLQIIIETLQKFIVKDIRQPHKRFWYALKGYFKHHMKLVAESRQIINAIIEERRQSKETHDDLLDMLLNAQYEDGTSMTNNQLIDEILILFVAGHETTANALTFTLFLLANNKSEFIKAQNESITITNNAKALESLPKLNYIKQCIEESMRLYPSAWITDRIALEDDVLGNYQIKKGTLIGVSIYEMHRNTTYWSHAERFQPERFSEENKKETSAFYMPFGAGPRLCIGNNFAMYEMMLTINAIINKFDIETNKTEVKLNPLITLKPVDVELKLIFRSYA